MNKEQLKEYYNKVIATKILVANNYVDVLHKEIQKLKKEIEELKKSVK